MTRAVPSTGEVSDDPALAAEHVDVGLRRAGAAVQADVAPQGAADGEGVGDLARPVEIAQHQIDQSGLRRRRRTARRCPGSIDHSSRRLVRRYPSAPQTPAINTTSLPTGATVVARLKGHDHVVPGQSAQGIVVVTLVRRNRLGRLRREDVLTAGIDPRPNISAAREDDGAQQHRRGQPPATRP